ncbi:MAG: EamA family transporter [Candidatus Dojkabacteria bacterium]|nr:EamA family transporter [Candidatus Dojkabacteria bacterium]MDQ7020633.1 EamA family transporter [Candidatus Dojkabacteria bacterium]
MYILLALGSLISFSSFNILIRKIAKDEDNPETLGMLFTTIAGILSLPLLLLDDEIKIEKSYNSLWIIGSLIGWTIISLGLGITYKHIKASTNTILGQTTSIFSLLIGVFIFSSEPSLISLFGISLIIFGNIYVFFKEADLPNRKAFILRILLSLVFAITYAFDSKASQYYPQGLFIFIAYVIPGILLYFLVPKITIGSIKQMLIKYNLKLLLLGLFSLIGYLLLIKSYSTDGELYIIIPIVNSQSLLTVILSNIFLKEDSNILKVILGGIAASLGVILLAI